MPRTWPLNDVVLADLQSALLLGYDQGVLSGIVGNANFLDEMGHPSDSLTGIMVSIYNLGCFSGCILNFIFGEYFGRRRAMWIAMVWILVCMLRVLELHRIDVHFPVADGPQLVALGGSHVANHSIFGRSLDGWPFRHWDRDWD